MANEEQRVSELKRKVETLKTSLAIEEDQRDRLLKDLEPESIKSTKDAEKKIVEISDEIDGLEALRGTELVEAEKYLEQYNV